MIQNGGQTGTGFDFATVEVKWKGCSANTVDVKDLFLSNGDKSFKKTIQWKEAVCCEAKVTPVAASRKKSSEKQPLQQFSTEAHNATHRQMQSSTHLGQ